MSQVANGQTTDKAVKPLSITLTNGLQYTSAQLAKGPVVLVYFSPDCDHCQHFTEYMIKNYNKVANKQVVMITFQDMSMLKPFVNRYKLSQYPNIKVGTKGQTLLVQRYYGIHSFPYVAIYDKAGKHFGTSEGDKPYDQIFGVLEGI